MNYLLDTNVLSELRRKRPDRHVLAWFDRVPAAQLYVSVLTLGEIRTGIKPLRRRDSRTAGVLEGWIGSLVTSYRDRIVSIDAEIAAEWGRLNSPDPIPVIDGLIAASAKVRGATLVTRNGKDFANLGVAVLNPFEPHH